MRSVYFTAGLILGVAIAVLALQNTDHVVIRFLTWEFEGSMALVILSSVGAGLLTALLFGGPQLLAARWRIRGLERRLEGRPPTQAEPDTRRVA